MATKPVSRLNNKPSESLQALEQDILAQGSDYEFFQTYRLLDSVNQSYPVSPRRPARKIEVKPSLSLGYTDQDVHDVKILDKQGGYEIVSQLPGLYGVASPLPDFYNEELLDNEWDDLAAPREFLDIIHKQLFPKLYQAWRLYKLPLNTIEKSNDSYWSLLANLMGQPSVDAQPLNNGSSLETQNERDFNKLKLRYFNLFSNRERSKDGLTILARDFLQLDDLSITEFVPEDVVLPEALRCQLGVQNSLLGEAHLGSKIFTQTQKVTIDLNNLSESDYRRIHGDQSVVSTLGRLVSEYLDKPIKVDLRLHVKPDLYQLQLGTHWHVLGQTAVLGKAKDSVNPVVVTLLR